MHLTSLTLKGFKSFASATTLRFEPGITAVVGPNGSGKSNVVDAITWVLGEQGAKALRGAKMEDVIFAGTAGRPPLGRAEVTLTIDNHDQALPIDYSEVSITRRMFRDGASEYEINGASARLLDIQELLSDSGIGREMHVIVGQGQLDSVLQARPEDRRGFIEEAAGVLKHRKRKEKALRKLDAMQANLTRLSDLTGELRRQLKPLGRQAEVARRAAGVQAELRDSRLRLLADDLLTLRTRFETEAADEESVRAERSRCEAQLGEARERESTLDAAQVESAPALSTAQDTWHQLAALHERFRGTSRLAAERHRLLSQNAETDRTGRDPEALETDAAAAAVEHEQLLVEVEQAHTALGVCVSTRADHEQALATAERNLVAAARAVADRREGLATLTGQVNALRTRASAGAEEISRLSVAAEHARGRAAAAESALEAMQGEVGDLDAGELGLDEHHERALAAHEELSHQGEQMRAQRDTAERDLSTWTARHDALALSLNRRDGVATLLTSEGAPDGILGPVAEQLGVQNSFETAIAAALGSLAEALTVRDGAVALAALELLEAGGGGQAGLVRADAEADSHAEADPEADSHAHSEADSDAAHRSKQLPAGARWALDVVTVGAPLTGPITRALAGVAVTEDLNQARVVVDGGQAQRAVDRVGNSYGRDLVAGGSSSPPSTLEIQAAVDEAAGRVEGAGQELARTAAELAELAQRTQSARVDVERTLSELHESDARLSAVTSQLAELGQQARAGHAEAERLDTARADAEQARERDLAGLAELEERLHSALDGFGAPGGGGGVGAADDPSTEDRDRRRALLADARHREMEARLSARTVEERARSLGGRVESLQRAARQERAARARQLELRRARSRAAAVAAAVHEAAETALGAITASVDRAVGERDRVASERAAGEIELTAVRAQVRELAARVEKLTDAVHRDEVLRAEQRLRIEGLQQRAVEEYGVQDDALLAEYGPGQPVPPSSLETAEYEQARDRGEDVVAPQPGPFHRGAQEKRASRAERDLALLGKVNPLALEEFAALEERHQFLSTQLEDIKDTRRDLLSVVKEVDERILEVFTAAYHDVAREFEIVFATLFPGGEGRLVLTNPEDMLTTGIEVEARPPGKKVKRLSLLSGGERSLTAVALLVAIFRARPSPFYIMDEVEAALDDVNLGRLIALIEQLRESSQVIVITHQKRTMEIADALYGVTMRGDGISQVISQRLRERAPAPAADGGSPRFEEQLTPAS